MNRAIVPVKIFCCLVAMHASAGSGVAQQPPQDAAERQAWELAVNSATPSAFLDFYHAYPASSHITTRIGTVRGRFWVKLDDRSQLGVIVTVEGMNVLLNVPLEEAVRLGVVGSRPVTTGEVNTTGRTFEYVYFEAQGDVIAGGMVVEPRDHLNSTIVLDEDGTSLLTWDFSEADIATQPSPDPTFMAGLGWPPTRLLNDADGPRVELFRAVSSGDAEMVSAVLAMGVNVNAIHESGATALMLASEEGHHDIVQVLLDAKGVKVNANSDGATPLILASQNGHSEIVSLLLPNGADVNAKTDRGSTALIRASQNGHTEIVNALLSNGAAVNAKQTNGATPLLLASQNGHSEVVSLLLPNGADVNATDTGSTALIRASQNGHTEIVNALLSNGAAVNAKQENGASPLILASDQGHSEIVSLLLPNGADVNAKTDTGSTALIRASQSGHTEIVNALLSNGAAVNAKQENGATPLILASQNGHSEIVSLLLSNEADVNAKGDDGASPLYFASQNGHAEIVSQGTVMDHFGFKVRNLEAVLAT